MKQESTHGGSGQVVTRVGTPGGAVAVERLGDPTSSSSVVFLHGLTANRSTWKRAAEMVGSSHRLLLVDLLARGQSDGAPGARFDLRSEASRLAAVLTELKVRRPVLAGHSHGAAVAVAAARSTGARSLLLVNPVTPAVPRPLLLAALRPGVIRKCAGPTLGLFRGPLTRYMLVRRVFTGEASMPPDAVARYADPWADRERVRSLPEILAAWDPGELSAWATPPPIPVRVLAGDRDRRIEPAAARTWAETLGGTYELLAGCGHAIPEEEPEVAAGALRELLATVHEEREELQHDQE